MVSKALSGAGGIAQALISTLGKDSITRNNLRPNQA
jgi:hypothetical protein